MLANASLLTESPTILSPHVVQNIDRVLNAVRAHLRMDVAFISEFLGPNRVLRNVDCCEPNGLFKAGDVIPLAVGYCKHVASGALPELMADTATVELARSIPETASVPIGAHLSVPIKVDDECVFGTFCCFSHVPQPGLGQRDLDLLRVFGRLLASEISADVSESRARHAAVERVTSAIRNGDPDLVFQPIRSLVDGSLSGVECLSRFMTKPARPPDEWFAEAHSVGMGAELELLVARKAISTCAVLSPSASLSINISPDTLLQGEQVAQALSGFDPGRLVIEITEHHPVADYQSIIEALAPLRAQGIRVAIDDAGAGYSSMRHILDLRPDIIKFDISLTRNVDRDPVRQALAAALGVFAQRAGTTVIAEGIETQAEFDALRDVGFHSGQGYLLGRPKALNDLFDW